MSSGHHDDQSQIRGSILEKYPCESNDLTVSPLRDSSRGKVENEDVLISYRLERRDYHHTGALFDCIVWQKTYRGHDDDSYAIGVIALKYVVGIHPLGDRHSGEYSLLFVHPSEDSNISHSMNLNLRSVTIVDPPEDFLSDFLCSEKPEHLCVPQTNSYPNLHVLLSHTVDTKITASTWETLVQPLLGHFALSQHADYAVHDIFSEDKIFDFVSSLLLPRSTQGTRQTVILLGGDDAVTGVLNAMLSTGPTTYWDHKHAAAETKPYDIPGFVKPTLGLIPCGANNILAHNNYITGNRITKHSTRGLRTLLLGCINPLQYFRTKFSPGARLIANSTQGEARLSFGTMRHNTDTHELEENEAYPTLYGAIVASWALHPHEMAQYYKDGPSGIETAAQDQLQPPLFRVCKGKVILYEAERMLPEGPDADGILVCQKIDRRELVRREHTCVLVTCCASLDEGLRISPQSELGEGFMVIEFGPSIPQTERNIEADNGRTRAKDNVVSSNGDEKTRKVIEAAHNQGAHIRDTWVGYHEVRSIRIETCGTEDERERLFCVDGKLISVDKAGWLEVTAMDHYKEGVLDLINREWEESELSIGEEQQLPQTFYPPPRRKGESEALHIPIDEWW
ncbi:hypothetical protein KC335_g15346 [Hortaea werneckii]|nr:hypothetical protein KC366_g17433 [Hortaea werneckii]KAI7253025.1 hypothetical protein KC335_g15346 [Hortaea werneckii]KAI7392079.1 hypothetical protein KC336_g16607 [Hortaea werneckii]